MKSILCSVLFVAVATSGALAQGTYQNIDVPGSIFTYGYGMNSSGEIVGAFADSLGEHGFLLSGWVYTTLDYPGADTTTAVGINDNEQIVGGTLIPPNSPGYIYDRASGTFAQITYPGAICSVAVAVNNHGTLLAFAYPNPGDTFEQDPSGRQKLLSFGRQTSATAMGITDSGLIYGTLSSPSIGTHNFKYQGGKLQLIGIPGASGFINGTNPNGTALIGTLSGGTTVDSFLYENGTVQTIAYPGARDTYAYGVNNAGQVSGTYYTATDGPHGFLWTPSAHAATK